MSEKKMPILDRLIKDGSIDLSEALILLESEKEFINTFNQPLIPSPTLPWSTRYPNYPNPYDIIGERSESIFGDTKPMDGQDAEILNKTFKRMLKSEPSKI